MLSKKELYQLDSMLSYDAELFRKAYAQADGDDVEVALTALLGGFLDEDGKLIIREFVIRQLKLLNEEAGQ